LRDHDPGKVTRRTEIGREIGDNSPCAGAHPTTDEKAMLPLGGDHRYRYRGRNRSRDRNRLLRTNKTDCDCDCDCDTDTDVFGFLLLFSEQSHFSQSLLESAEILPAKKGLSPISCTNNRLPLRSLEIVINYGCVTHKGNQMNIPR
jgi:hypothetical protein